MVFGWGDAEDAHRQVYNDDGGEQHEGKFSHELLAGGAAFAGFKAYEDHQRKEGNVVNHAFAKEALAGFVGAEVDKLAETKGLDEYDRERTHHRAKEASRDLYDQHYGDQDQYDPNQTGPPPQLQGQGGYGDGGYGGGGYGSGGYGSGGGYGGGNNNY